MRQCDSPAPFQFGLRRLLGVVGMLAVLFAIMHRVGFLWSIAIGWILLLIAAHVIANAWGTRARDARRRLAHEASDSLPSAVEPECRAARPIRFAPETRLRRAHPLSRLMFVLTGGGAVVGGVAGTTALVVSTGGAIGAGGIVVGGVSSTILGGILGFLTSTSAGVAYRAWREASAEVDKSSPAARRACRDSDAVTACPSEPRRPERATAVDGRIGEVV